MSGVSNPAETKIETMHARPIRLACALLALSLAAAAGSAWAAPAGQRQYTFTGQCNGLQHWVSMLYDRKKDHVTNLVVRASCPVGEPSVYRIHREKIIPVYMGGTFSRVIRYPGVSYVITGRIVSRKKAVLRHKGPAKTLTCPGSEPLKAKVCEKFELKAR